MGNNSLFVKQLSVLFEETDIFSSAADKMAQMDRLKNEMRGTMDDIYVSLASLILRQCPRLTARPTQRGLVVQYKQSPRQLTLAIDARNRSWYTRGQFANQFNKYFAEALTGNIEGIAKAVANFFKGNYSGLQGK